MGNLAQAKRSRGNTAPLPIPADIPREPTLRAVWFARSLNDGVGMLNVLADAGADGTAEDAPAADALAILFGRIARDVAELRQLLRRDVDGKSVDHCIGAIYPAGTQAPAACGMTGTCFTEIALRIGDRLISAIVNATAPGEERLRYILNRAVPELDPVAAIDKWPDVLAAVRGQSLTGDAFDGMETQLLREYRAISEGAGRIVTRATDGQRSNLDETSDTDSDTGKNPKKNRSLHPVAFACGMAFLKELAAEPATKLNSFVKSWVTGKKNGNGDDLGSEGIYRQLRENRPAWDPEGKSKLRTNFGRRRAR